MGQYSSSQQNGNPSRQNYFRRYQDEDISIDKSKRDTSVNVSNITAVTPQNESINMPKTLLQKSLLMTNEPLLFQNLDKSRQNASIIETHSARGEFTFTSLSSVVQIN